MKKVIISAPAKDEDITIVIGVNDDKYDGSQNVISNASCTTNCLGPVRQGAQRRVRHRARSDDDHPRLHQDQNLQDGPHKDLRRARAAAVNIIPTSTGAAKAIGLVLPELKGKLDGYALRVPIPTGSVTDLTVDLSKRSQRGRGQRRDEGRRRGQAQGHPEYYRRPDRLQRHRHRPARFIFDAGLTKVIGDQAKVVCWYDNEWGYSNRLVDLVALVGKSL